jgi:hypothetical protein
MQYVWTYDTLQGIPPSDGTASYLRISRQTGGKTNVTVMARQNWVQDGGEATMVKSSDRPLADGGFELTYSPSSGAVPVNIQVPMKVAYLAGSMQASSYADCKSMTSLGFQVQDIDGNPIKVPNLQVYEVVYPEPVEDWQNIDNNQSFDTVPLGPLTDSSCIDLTDENGQFWDDPCGKYDYELAGAAVWYKNHPPFCSGIRYILKAPIHQYYVIIDGDMSNRYYLSPTFYQEFKATCFAGQLPKYFPGVNTPNP